MLTCTRAVGLVQMNEHTASEYFTEETFWWCWVFFLAKSIAHQMNTQTASLHPEEEGVHNDESLHEDLSVHGEDQGNTEAESGGRDLKGAVTITLKNARQLPPMDTFSGKADPYVVSSCEGMTHKSSVRAGTLEPNWNDTMKFNCYANKSTVRYRVYLCHLEVLAACILEPKHARGAPLNRGWHRLGAIVASCVMILLVFVQDGSFRLGSDGSRSIHGLLQLHCSLEPNPADDDAEADRNAQ